MTGVDQANRRCSPIRLACSPKAYCIGVDIDQWHTLLGARPCWVTSTLRHIEPGIAELVIAIHNNGFSGGNTVGPVGLAPFHDFDSVVTTEMRDTLDAVAAGLKNGSITPGMSCLDWPLPPTVGNRGDDQAMA
ncbi:MAG: hypothetical protein F4162_02430 [Synechococcus sp. SB0676_bin_10]|uniref:Uncharacterized protein n=1 Tax=Synechococcus sp. SB0676_bin_10 TaxID=2604869 RepID=A0A6B1F4E2_9SYNE|nr:hypothetical protein [Cyanobacteria bacterium MAG IRC4_bin_6]MYG37871.1 hypothetical protein [Synechococcus sp. SB0676_bin_10]